MSYRPLLNSMNQVTFDECVKALHELDEEIETKRDYVIDNFDDHIHMNRDGFQIETTDGCDLCLEENFEYEAIDQLVTLKGMLTKFLQHGKVYNVDRLWYPDLPEPLRLLDYFASLSAQGFNIHNRTIMSGVDMSIFSHLELENYRVVNMLTTHLKFTSVKEWSHTANVYKDLYDGYARATYVMPLLEVLRVYDTQCQTNYVALFYEIAGLTEMAQ